MVFKYGALPSSQFYKEKERLCGAIFKLLPYKQEGYEFLDNYFVTIMQWVCGLNGLIGYKPELITLMCILESARYEDDFKKYRKAILDACALIDKIEEGDSDV